MDLFSLRADHGSHVRAVDSRLFQWGRAPFGPTGNQHGRLLVARADIGAGGLFLQAGELAAFMGKHINTGWVTVRLRGDGGSTNETPWKVMENGQVLDAGRGLPAIEQIKKLIGAHRIEVTSNHSEVDGLTFDAQGLDPLIRQARSTCRW